MSVMEASFIIPEKNKAGALEAIKKLCEQEQEIGGGGCSTIGTDGSRGWKKHFSWVDSSVLLKAETLYEAMEEWGWIIEEDDYGEVHDIYFEREKIGDEEYLFNAIAPFVEDGSYIQMHGEDDYIWRWVFINGECHDVGGRVVFDE
jgi:hypothetical protein